MRTETVTTTGDGSCCCDVDCTCNPGTGGCATCPGAVTVSNPVPAPGCEGFPITFTNPGVGAGNCQWTGGFAHILNIGRNPTGGCYCASLILIALGQATYTYFGTTDPCVAPVTLNFVVDDGICPGWPLTLTLGP